MKTTPIAVSSFIEAAKAQALPVIFNLAIVLKPYAADHHKRGNVLGAEFHVEDGYFRDTSANIKIYPNAIDSVVLVDIDGLDLQAPVSQPVEEKKVLGTPVQFSGIDPLDPVRGAVLPMIPDSWRYGFVQTDSGLLFTHQDNGPFVAWEAVKDFVNKPEQTAIADLHDAPVQIAQEESTEQQDEKVEEAPQEQHEEIAPAVQEPAQQVKAGHVLPKSTRDFVKQRKIRR